MSSRLRTRPFATRFRSSPREHRVKRHFRLESNASFRASILAPRPVATDISARRQAVVVTIATKFYASDEMKHMQITHEPIIYSRHARTRDRGISSTARQVFLRSSPARYFYRSIEIFLRDEGNVLLRAHLGQRRGTCLVRLRVAIPYFPQQRVVRTVHEKYRVRQVVISRPRKIIVLEKL